MVTPYQEAEVYFEQTWEQNREKLISSAITPANMKDGVTIPVDYCLSTIARAVVQDKSPMVFIEDIKNRLRESDPNQFYYPDVSTHITLLGCTPRASSKVSFSPEKRDKIRKICGEVFRNETAIDLMLQGVNIVGNQVFIQVFPKDRKWANFREKLEHNLIQNGESPISYPNKAPIHMNVMRITNAEPQRLQKLLKIIEHLRHIEIGLLEITKIDYLLTDFVVSPQNTEYIDTFHLNEGKLVLEES